MNSCIMLFGAGFVALLEESPRCALLVEYEGKPTRMLGNLINVAEMPTDSENRPHTIRLEFELLAMPVGPRWYLAPAWKNGPSHEVTIPVGGEVRRLSEGLWELVEGETTYTFYKFPPLDFLTLKEM